MKRVEVDALGIPVPIDKAVFVMGEEMPMTISRIGGAYMETVSDNYYQHENIRVRTRDEYITQRLTAPL